MSIIQRIRKSLKFIKWANHLPNASLLLEKVPLVLLPKYLRNNSDELFIALRPKEFQRSKAHFVSPSPWPFFSAISIAYLLANTASFFHYCEDASNGIFFGVFFFSVSVFFWAVDVIKEGSFEYMHTSLMQKAFRLGIILFIVSEVMFFFSFFWAFFHYSLSPSVFIFAIWPPYGVSTIDPWGIPFLNTIILLSSGITLTVAHRAIVSGFWNSASSYLYFTIFLGLIFTCCQLFEYVNCPFSINDSVYGSIFFMTTGFHGIHVIVGTLFLIISLYRVNKRHFTTSQHVGFELAAWYWHFVDVVWLFLFTSVYWWGY
jgi:cytochrome c oxidase subunit 3